jgi:hypothetical protein
MSEKLIQTISTLQPREDDLKLMGMSAGTAAVDTASQVE